MSEDSNNPNGVDPATEIPRAATHSIEATPAAPRRGNGVAWLALLLALGAAGWLGWQWWEGQRDAGEQDRARVDAALLEEQIEFLENRLQLLEGEQSRLAADIGGLRTRVGDNERINRSLREEMLGVGERAALVEDTVARLAERRLEGTAALRLDEAESLLRIAYERQRLFQDRDGALAALRLADATLTTIESAQLVNLRQTLRREISELTAVSDIDRAALARRLDDLRGVVARLPDARPQGTADSTAPAAPTLIERLSAALTRVVSVRRIGADAELERFPTEARRAGLTLEIELMRTSLAARDDEAWQRGVNRMQVLLAEGFEPTAQSLGAAREIVAELSAARLVEAAPAPDAALRELSNLRAMRSLTADPAPLPQAAPQEDSAPETDEPVEDEIEPEPDDDEDAP